MFSGSTRIPRKAARCPVMACRSPGTPRLGRGARSASPKSSMTSRCKRDQTEKGNCSVPLAVRSRRQAASSFGCSAGAVGTGLRRSTVSTK